MANGFMTLRFASLILSSSLVLACNDPSTPTGDARDEGGACAWPAGAHGVEAGQTLPEIFAWEGYPARSTQTGSVRVRDFFDCDGSSGVRAVLFITAVFSCDICRAEAAGLEARMVDWEPMGIEVVTLLLDAPGGGPPTVEAAELWKTNFTLDSVAVVSDPNESLVPGTIKATPQHSIVDPRTMNVVAVREGYDDDYAELLALAETNAN